MDSMNYKELRKAMAIKQQERAHRWNLVSNLMVMFEHKNIPFRKEFVENYLLFLGICAIGKHDDTYYVGYPTAFEYDEYGLPKEGSMCTFQTRFGYTFSGIIGTDIIIGYNKESRTPELIDYYAYMFSEIDKSMLTNVIKSRVNPIPIARDEKEKKSIKTAIEEGEKGITNVIMSENILEEIATDKKGINTVSLTEPEQIERIQYLSKFYDDLLRRFWTQYGHSLSSASKMAQVTTSELEGYETLSMIRPYDMLECRKDLYNRCNDVFGTDFQVDFSPAWKHLKETGEETTETIEEEEQEEIEQEEQEEETTEEIEEEEQEEKEDVKENENN